VRIAIDVRTVRAQRAGIGLYTQLLLEGLAAVRQQEAFTLVGAPDTCWELLPSGPGFRHVTLGGPGALWHLKAAAIARQVDVYHSPSSLFVPLMAPDRSVVTVHDLVPFLMPEVSSAKTWWTHRVFERTVTRLRAVITDSQSAAQDLRDMLPAIRTPIETIPLAPRPAFRPANPPQRPLPFDYFLAVGTLEPRKNLPMLLRAYRKAATVAPDLPQLVIAGKLGWKNAEFEALLADTGLRERVHLAGYVSDAELLTLFQGAIAFVYPSLYEGFGLPVLEAMACGTPVITSACSSLPEVGGEAALYVDPTDESAWAETLLRVRDPGLRAALSRSGIAQAARFSWTETARRTLALYHEVEARARR
jgi:glycosyltransferase involved in cell wall biosynthesis